MGVHWAHLRPSCKHGHPYPEHLARLPNGWAYCRECQRLKQRARHAPSGPDGIAIERAIDGDPPDQLTPDEREAVVITLTRRGISARLIAEQARCTPRTVHRIRTRTAAAA